MYTYVILNGGYDNLIHDFGGSTEKSVNTENAMADCASSEFRTDARMIGDSKDKRACKDSAPLKKINFSILFGPFILMSSRRC